MIVFVIGELSGTDEQPWCELAWCWGYQYYRDGDIGMLDNPQEAFADKVIDAWSVRLVLVAGSPPRQVQSLTSSMWVNSRGSGRLARCFGVV